MLPALLVPAHWRSQETICLKIDTLCSNQRWFWMESFVIYPHSLLHFSAAGRVTMCLDLDWMLNVILNVLGQWVCALDNSGLAQSCGTGYGGRVCGTLKFHRQTITITIFVNAAQHLFFEIFLNYRNVVFLISTSNTHKNNVFSPD